MELSSKSMNADEFNRNNLNANTYQYTINNKTIVVYPSHLSGTHVVYLNTFGEEGGKVYETLQRTGVPEFTLVTINGLNWNHDMAPWDIPPVFAGEIPFIGGADEYLKLFSTEIMPIAEEKIPGCISWRGIAGYSLAGLFALYSLYKTEVFSRAASISGSLWFPGIMEYIFAHELKKKAEYLYFSLGDRECRTRNPYMKIVQENTEKIEDFYKSQGIETVFKLNPGGHFNNAVDRTAAGIARLLGRS